MELAKIVLQVDGVEFLLSEKFSQDPLEEHFSRQRRCGGSNENPNLLQFERQEVMINVATGSLTTDLRGNIITSRDGDNINICDKRLPKKQRKN